MNLLITNTGKRLVMIGKEGTVQFHHSVLADEIELLGVSIPA